MSDKPDEIGSVRVHETVLTEDEVKLLNLHSETVERLSDKPAGLRDYHDVPFPEGTQPKPTGEWTTKYVHELMNGIGADARIADEHNAALAAERVKWNDALEANRQTEKLLSAERDWSEHLRIQLAAEVEKVNKLQEQLAAERVERCEVCNSELSQCGVQGVDGEPSLDCLVCKLREQLAALQKKWDKLADEPMVQALRRVDEQLAAEQDRREGDNKLIRALAEDAGIKITAPDKMPGLQWEQFHDGVMQLAAERHKREACEVLIRDLQKEIKGVIK